MPERVAAIYQHQAGQQEVQIKVQSAPGLRGIQVDPERMEQVPGNLVGNVMRYTPEGGEISLVAEQTFDVAQDKAEGSLIVSVEDNGFGITPKTLPLISSAPVAVI